MMDRPRIRRLGEVLGISVFDGEPGVGADDGYSRSSGQFANNQSQLYLGQNVSTIYDVFCRFPNVTIPGGATVMTAYLTYDVYNNGGGHDKTNIYFCDEDDPAAPTDQAEHAADPRTTAFTAWDDEVMVDDIQSPSIVNVIQEILDRGGWNSGQAMMLLHDDDGTADGTYSGIASFEQGTKDAAQLHVEYLS